MRFGIGDKVHVVDRDWIAQGTPWRVLAGIVIHAYPGVRAVCRVDLRRYRGRGHPGYAHVEGWRLYADEDLDAAFDAAIALNQEASTKTPIDWTANRNGVIG